MMEHLKPAVYIWEAIKEIVFTVIVDRVGYISSNSLEKKEVHLNFWRSKCTVLGAWCQQYIQRGGICM